MLYAANQVTIRLNWSEIMLAVNAGVMRRIYALKAEKQGVYGASDECVWDNDINGALAEFGCAKWANVFWNETVGITTAPDVGKWQVRSKVVDGHRLVVRPSDSDDAVYVSVLIQLPIVVMCGWLFGHEAKRSEWYHEYLPKPGMYFVEDKYLHDMQSLKDPLQAKNN